MYTTRRGHRTNHPIELHVKVNTLLHYGRQ